MYHSSPYKQLEAAFATPRSTKYTNNRRSVRAVGVMLALQFLLDRLQHKRVVKVVQIIEVVEVEEIQ